MIFLQVKILKLNGNEFVAADDANRNIMPINGWGYALMKGLEVKINGTIVQHNDGMYAYRGEMYTKLNTHGYLKQFLELMGYESENRAFENVPDGELNWALDADPDEHPVLTRKYKRIRNGKRAQYISLIFGDIFEQQKVLPPNTTVELTFTRNDDFFTTLAKNEARRCIVKIEDCIVFANFKDVLTDIVQDISNTTQTLKQKFPITRIEMKYYTKPPNITNLDITNIFTGVLPRRFFFGMVHGNAFNGRKANDPFNFQPFGIKEICFKIGNDTRPYPPLKMDFANDLTVLPLYYLQKACNMAFSEEVLGINMYNYGERNTLFGYDLSVGDIDESFERNVQEETRLEITLEAGVGHDIVIVILAEYDAEITIDENQKVELLQNA